MTQVSIERSNLMGALCAFTAALCFSFNDVAIKFVSDGYALHQVVFFRAMVAIPVFLVFVMPFFGGLQVFRTRRPLAHVARGLCVVCANSFLFMGLAALPIADAVAIFFVSPLVITVFSIIFLREKVGARRWGAIAVGFVGVLLIVRPGTSAFQLASVFPMIAATLYAGMHIIARRIGDTESAATMAIFSQTSFVILSVTIGLSIGDGRFADAAPEDLNFLLRAWAPIDPADIPVFILLGVSGLAGVLFISQAYRLSEAAFAASFEYVSMPMAIMWGVTVFGTWPDGVAWAGITLILGSGLYLVWRESRKGQHVTDGPVRR
ncbi:DMT family transporter [Roseovarius indicus]|uniref:DMT family transporter n=1 Tax=Roseovarius indicus TaxID=540747 RepID=UPI0032EF3075